MLSKEFGRELGRMMRNVRTQQEMALEIIPDDVRALMLKLDNSGDDLRPAWSAVREYMLYVIAHREKLCRELTAVTQAAKSYVDAFDHGTADEADRAARKLQAVVLREF